MCGLVGIFSSCMQIKHKHLMSALLYLDTFRGRDSTGVAAIRANTDTDILKSPVPGFEFVEGPRLFEHLKSTDFCWIGHNRHGTVGGKTKNNAHPFLVFEDTDDGGVLLVGAHNGTLQNKGVLTNHSYYGTDSQALFEEISLLGLKAAMAKVLGAWALTYYDHLKEELIFLRNEERPFYYAYEEGCTTLIWASEDWILRAACSASGIKLENNRTYSTEVDTVYRISAPLKNKEKLTLRKGGKILGKEVVIPPPFQGNGGKTLGTTSHYSNEYWKNQSKLKVVADNTKTTLNLNTALKVFKGFAGSFLSRKELDEQLAGGCSWCELEHISSSDKFAWLEDNSPVCRKCLSGIEEPATPQLLKKTA